MSGDSVGSQWSTSSYVLVASYLSILLGLSLATLSRKLSRRRNKQQMVPRMRDRLSIPETVVEMQGSAMQTGYKSGSGLSLLIGWLLTLFWGHLNLIVYTLAWYRKCDPLFLINPDATRKFESVYEPWQIMFFASAGVSLFVAEKWENLKTLCMSMCPLDDATMVVVSANGQETRCFVEKHLDSPPYFEFMCFRYVYVESHQRFRPVGEIEVSGPMAQAALHAGGMSHASAEEKQQLAGKNRVYIYVPGIVESVLEELRLKIYVYQYYIVMVKYFQKFWNIGLSYLFLITFAILAKALFITRPNRLKIQSLALTKTRSWVQRESQNVQIPSEDLVAGDLFLVETGTTLPCDCVLVNGAAVVNEAMLTGEPMPIAKTAISDQARSPNNDSTLFAGTETLDASGFAMGEVVGALAMVQAIGGATQKADLLRLVLFPARADVRYDSDLRTVYILLCVYSIGLLVLLMAVPYPGNKGSNAIATFWKALGCVFQVVNPLLGVALARGPAVSASTLRSKGMHCLAPEKIPLSGCVDVMVLDKTGTITEAGMRLYGLQACTDERIEEVQLASKGLSDMSMMMQYFMASCHKLVMFDGQVIGNHVEMEMFRRASAWQLHCEDKRYVKNLKTGESVEILKVLEFDHARMTSGCISKLPNDDVYLFLKGAPSRVQSLCAQAPNDFAKTADDWSAKCFYTLGCAWKPLSIADFTEATRETLESGLTACGLLLFENALKTDSSSAIEEIQGGDVKVIVCTGDHLMAGVSVARQTNIIKASQNIIRISYSSNGLFWSDVDTGRRGHESSIFQLAAKTSTAFVMDHEAWDDLSKSSSLLSAVAPQLCVVGRVKPEGKVSVVQALQSLGHTVGMCGDGGNDCGALRSAHIGLALSSAEASIVAPFSSGENTSLHRVGDLLKEGRACLGNNVGSYSFFLAYGLSLTSVKTSLLLVTGAFMSEFQYLYIDVFLSIVMPWAITHCKASQTLAQHRPPISLLATQTVLKDMGAFFALIFLLVLSFMTVRIFPGSGFAPWDPVKLSIPAHVVVKLADNFETEVGFTVLAVHLSTCGFVYSYGSHYRQAVFKNVRLMMAYALTIGILLSLLLTGPNAWSCLFRINCDSRTSMHNYIPGVSAFSSFGTDTCFLGPQMLQWGQSPKDVSIAVHEALTPRDGRLECVPTQDFMRASHMPGDLRDPVYINNVMGTGFRIVFVLLLALHFVAMHCFQHLVVFNKRFDQKSAASDIRVQELELRELPSAHSI